MLVQDILGENPVPVDYGKVPVGDLLLTLRWRWRDTPRKRPRRPATTWSRRSISSAGNSRAQILGELDGLVKIIAEKRADGSAGTILGVHMVGPWVTEQLGAGYLSVNWEATVDEVAHFIQPHPSLSELFGESVLAMTGRSCTV